MIKRVPNVAHTTVAAGTPRLAVATAVVVAHAVPAAKSGAAGVFAVATAPRCHNILQWYRRNKLLNSSTIALVSLVAQAPRHSLSGDDALEEG